MKTATQSEVTDEMVDDYIAEQYNAMRAGNLDSFTARLMAMGEEADTLGKGGNEAATVGLRAMAKWEIEQQ